MTPMPPCRAISIAMLLSVTVSILAETIGIFRRMLRESDVVVSTVRREVTVVRWGVISTSS